jgi:EPS-associated MarR family transcriptional regulator
MNYRDQEHTLKVLNVLEKNASPTQRELSQDMRLSLGKINYLLTSLIKAGFITVRRFKNSKKKRAYLYLLTPEGLKQRAVLTRKFLFQKMKEYEDLKREIEDLKKANLQINGR